MSKKTADGRRKDMSTLYRATSSFEEKQQRRRRCRILSSSSSKTQQQQQQQQQQQHNSAAASRAVDVDSKYFQTKLGLLVNRANVETAHI